MAVFLVCQFFDIVQVVFFILLQKFFSVFNIFIIFFKRVPLFPTP
jgi:hypothetical protein